MKTRATLELLNDFLKERSSVSLTLRGVDDWRVSSRHAVCIDGPSVRITYHKKFNYKWEVKFVLSRKDTLIHVYHCKSYDEVLKHVEVFVLDFEEDG